MSERLDPDAMLLSSLWSLSRAMGEVVGPFLRREGLSNGGFFVLHLLGPGPSPTVGGLAEKLGIHISGVTHLVNELEEKGLVRRERSRADRRVVTLMVTLRGSRALHRIEQLALEQVKAASRLVPRSRKLDAARILTEVAGGLQGRASRPGRNGKWKTEGSGRRAGPAGRGVGGS